ncbi:MAG: hypothetical protein IKJ11_03190 [Clostridia bacterium]|nr:hypothetical protein [Clostridia bacterium]
MRIIALIRKHALLLALACALLGLTAAPYLVPENPDSEVWRNGTLGIALLLLSIFPLRDAFEKAEVRQLLCGLCIGFLYALALSIGAELSVYQGLLPGMGSMIRRMAVPCMATPLLGGLAARLIMACRVRQREKAFAMPLWGYMLIILLCWLPLFLAHYPAMLNYDFNTEYRQFYYREWDGRHPLLYIVLCYGVFSIGRLLEQPTFAIAVVTLIRMTTFAAALAYSCTFVQKRRAPLWLLALLTAAYALLPIFSVMSVSTAKDTPFAAAVLTLSLLAYEAIEDPQAFFASRRRIVAFVLMTVLSFHLRKNGAAILLLFPALLFVMRGWRKPMLRLCAVGTAASLLLGAGMNAVFKPFDQPSFQLYSLPAQQLVRAYNNGNLSEADREEIRSWYIDDLGLTLRPYIADSAKGYIRQDLLREHADEFMSLWARIGRQCPRIYAEAFLMLNTGSWYPDDLTHSVIYDSSWWHMGYLQTNEYDFSEYGVTFTSFLPKVKLWVERICRDNTYQKLPLLSVLLCTATPVWVLVFAGALLVSRKQTKYLAAFAGVLALWISYQFGPCTLPRYMLPLFCLAPVMLISSLYLNER